MGTRDLACCQPSGDQPRRGESPEKQGKLPVPRIQAGSFPSCVSHCISCPAPAPHQGCSSIPPHHSMLPPTPKTLSSALVMLPALPNPSKTIKYVWENPGSIWAAAGPTNLLFSGCIWSQLGSSSPRLAIIISSGTCLLRYPHSQLLSLDIPLLEYHPLYLGTPTPQVPPSSDISLLWITHSSDIGYPPSSDIPFLGYPLLKCPFPWILPYLVTPLLRYSPSP